MSEFVYRTTKPEVLALHDAWKEEFDAQTKAIKAFKRKWPIKREGERKLRPLVMSSSFGGERVIGYQFWGHPSDAPEGWKVDRKRGVLEPKRTHPIGKQIAEDMAKCHLRNCRADLADHGMVTSSWEANSPNMGLAMVSPGIEFIEGACYVIWPMALKEGKGGYDPAIWEPVKLSEFYAAKERQEAAEKAEIKAS